MLLNRLHSARLGPVFKGCFSYPSGKSVDLATVSGAAEELGELRNAIAHHHPIFNWNFGLAHTYVNDMAGWMCPPIRAWLMGHHSRVVDLLKENPLLER
jgi:hypothetical protein